MRESTTPGPANAQPAVRRLRHACATSAWGKADGSRSLARRSPGARLKRMAKPVPTSLVASLVVWISAAILGLVLVVTVFAHAQPQTVKPGSGAVLNQAPSQIEMTMTETMARQGDANDIDVFDASGKEVTVVSAVIDNADRRKLSVPLPSDLAPGAYTVNWKTLSADDGDAANGSYTFIYNPAQSPSPGQEQLTPSLVGPDSTPAASSFSNSSDAGTPWVLLSSTAIGAFVLGGGLVFLLIQKRS